MDQLKQDITRPIAYNCKATPPPYEEIDSAEIKVNKVVKALKRLKLSPTQSRKQLLSMYFYLGEWVSEFSRVPGLGKTDRLIARRVEKIFRIWGVEQIQGTQSTTPRKIRVLSNNQIEELAEYSRKTFEEAQSCEGEEFEDESLSSIPQTPIITQGSTTQDPFLVDLADWANWEITPVQDTPVD